MPFFHLLRPGSIGRLTLANRVVMAPMATNFASATGETTRQQIAYYAARARGGTGLLIVENATIEHRRGGNGAVQLRLDDDRYVPGLHALVDAMHAGGAAVAIQVNHAGAVARTSAAPLAPSDVPWTATGRTPQPLTPEEIEALFARFAAAAVRAKRAGFDAVEIHGGHGYLIAQFLSPLVNRRTDDYGGSAERRWRFALEVVRVVREAVGAGFPLLFRVSGDEYLEGGRTIAETVDLARALVDAGVDALHVTAATAANPERQLEPMAYPEGWRIDLAAAVKSAVDVPVIGVGVLRTPETAERVLAEGKADFVAVGRGLIADPQWVEKAARGEPETIRRCISCNRCVRHRVFDDLPIRCSVNPRVGREAETIPPAVGGRRAVVVGAGPAGLTAAATAASRGHGVTLFESADVLGGCLRLAAVPPHKEKIGWLIDDLSLALPEAVDVRLGTRAEAADLVAIAPDLAILAGGSSPTRLDVPGATLPHVHTADDVLTGRAPIAGRVVVVGGGMVGCETALHCAKGGASVAIVEVLDAVACDCEPITRRDLTERLAARGVEIRVGAVVREIAAAFVRIDVAGREERLAAETVVCAVGRRPNRRLAGELSDAQVPVAAVGDAREARGICEAVYEGWRAALRLDEGRTEE